MTFLAPWALGAAAAAATLVVGLHFLARERPRAAVLPTARFVPHRPARATRRAPRPRDHLLLALRVLAVLLAGAAVARPVLRPSRRTVARVVALDISRSVDDVDAARDSVRAFLRPGDALVVFDRAARVVHGAAHDSLDAIPRGSGPGSLSGALVAAARAAGELRGRADSVELVLVSAFVREEWDAATAEVRGVWAGPARLVSVAAAPAAGHGSVQLAGAAENDPLRATLALLGTAGTGGAAVRIRRDRPTAADSAWARRAGHVLLHWPADPARAFGVRAHPDTVGAVVAGGAVLAAPLPRTADPPRTGASRVAAWWVDGEPAATEHQLGDGCIRQVAVALPSRGDLVLGEGARRLVSALIAPCGGARALAPLADSAMAVLRESSAHPPRPAAYVRPRSGAAAWLLAVSAALLLAEPLLRRREAAR